MSDICRVALDAMGGDNAPGEVVKGAVEATKKENDIHVFLSVKKQQYRQNWINMIIAKN